MARIGERKPDYPVTIHFNEEEYKMLINRKKKNGISISGTVKQCLAMANKPSSKAYDKTDKEYVKIFLEVTEEEKELLQDKANARGLTLTDYLSEEISEYVEEIKKKKMDI